MPLPQSQNRTSININDDHNLSEESIDLLAHDLKLHHQASLGVWYAFDRTGLIQHKNVPWPI